MNIVYVVELGAHDNVCIRVEEVVVLSARDLANVYVHTTIVGPVICPAKGTHVSPDTISGDALPLTKQR